MAPLSLDSSINTASLAGTWIGTVFTGVGLLAVLAQLRSLLRRMDAKNRRWKERAAGAWANCILVDRLPSNGIQEETVPNFSGWLQNFYMQERIITVSQDDRGVSGKSSWSNVFARMGIEAADLVAHGGSRRQPALTRKNVIVRNSVWVRPLRPGLGDSLVDNGSISYGFSAAEFAALIILCGFRPRDFAPQSSQHSTSYYGQMLVAEYGQFSQIAKFDSHHGFRDSPKSFKMDMCEIPVAHSLNLAFGMIRVKGRGGRDWVIPRERSTLLDIQDDVSSAEVWSAYALPQQLKTIRYSFERFVGTSELTSIDYSQRNDSFEADDVSVLDHLMYSSGFVPQVELSEDEAKATAREVLNAAHAVAAIVPWALAPVVPAHMVDALKIILDPFYKTTAFTIRVLQRELKMIPHQAFRPEGKASEELSQRLNLIPGDKNAFFEVDNSYLTSIYHESMSLVFRHKGIKLEDVRIVLAAAVGSRRFLRRVKDRGDSAKSHELFQQNMKKYLERCYLEADAVTEKSSRSVPEWAIDVYATYLWGWTSSFIAADPDLIGHFRRRVFLA